MSARRTMHWIVPATGVLATLVLAGWTGLSPDEPISSHGDHLLVLGYARSYLDGHGLRFNDRLGYPGVHDGMYHASFYFLQQSVMWATAHLVQRAETVVYVFYGIALGLVFGATYWSLRRFGIGRDLAWLGGLAFAIAPYVAVRTGMHDMISMPFSVPLGVVLAFLVSWPAAVGAPRTERSLADPFPWLLVGLIGMSGLYYAFFACFFVMLLGALSAVWHGRARPLVDAGLVCAAIVVVLLVTGPGLGLIDVITGQVALTRRFAGEQRLYGLVLRDALVAFRSWPAAPAAVTSGVGGMGSEGTWGEWPGVVLTIVILMSPFTCAWAVWRRRLHRGDDGLVALAVIGFASVAGIAFAVRGGLGLWFNELVTPAIRAQNRIMPYLTFFALLMLLGVADRARRAAERPGRATWTGGVALALALSAWPSVGFMQTKQQRVFADDGEQRDRRSIARLLEAVAAAGVNAVLQVPVAGWPEVPRIRGFDPYRFQLPYVLSPAGSPTRWSYGLSDRQPEFEELFAVVDGFRERGLASAAVGLGFDAVLVEKTALTTADLRTLTSSIESGLPAHCRVFDDEYRTAWQIGATSAHPDCAVGPSYGQRYVTAAGRHGLVLLRGGWSSPEPTHVWTDGPVASLVVLPLPVQDRARLPIDVSLSFAVYRPDPQRRKEIVFRASGRELRRLTILPGEPLPAGTTLTIPPDLTGDGPVGVDILIANPEQPSAYGADDRRQLGIALEALEVVGRDRRSHGTDAGRGFSPGLSLFSARESRQRR